MKVVKRDGSREPVSFDKVLQRIRKASRGLSIKADVLAQQVLARIVDGIKTAELDDLTAQMAASLCTLHPDWGTLAARIAVSNHQKSTPERFSDVVAALATQVAPKTGEPVSYVREDMAATVAAHAAEIDAYIKHDRDYLFDYFGFKTLEKAYLLKGTDGRILERPQHMWMRVAIGIWGDDLKSAFATYDMLSTKKMTHATPTLFNAGTPNQQLSSCFVAGTPVHTTDGVKNIENVVIGDNVVTHTGALKQVTQLHTNALGDRELYSLKIAGTPAFKVTGNHRLWSISDEKEKWGQKPGWNRVDYLRVGDWVAIPKKNQEYADFVLDVKPYLDMITGDGDGITYSYKYEGDKVYPKTHYVSHVNTGTVRHHCKNMNSFNRYWKFDRIMMELIGIWYGDGCVTHAKNSKGNMFPRNISIVSYHNNVELIQFVSESFKTYLGVDNMSLSTDAHGMTSMVINNTIIAHLFKTIFKSGFDGKRLPDFFNTLSYEHIRYFLAGLTSSDGCVSKSTSITIQLTNPELVTQIFHLARSVGIPITNTFMHNTRNGKPTGRLGIPTYVVAGLIKKCYEDDRLDRITECEMWNSVRNIDGTLFMRIAGKEICIHRPTHVYTIGVEDDHSYSVAGIIAENCYLISMSADSIAGIFKTLSDCAIISKYSGGIGLHIHNIRARGSLIKGTNGSSNGLVPMLRVFNNTARYSDQGGGRRNGSFAIYLEPWHADVEDFLKLKLNTGAEEERARDLFYAMWMPDLFMRRVEADADWSLFCPNEAPGLADVWGAAFEELYARYEAEGRARKVVSARKLWFQILDTQMETGTPYILYKDAANGKSNQQNLGTIKSSNLCTEILEYSDANETAVCNLASIALPAYIREGRYDFDELRRVVAQTVRNLNRVIDINFYPTPETKKSNMRHRPIGLGVQGLADVFAELGLAWEDDAAADLNQRIFEHIYYAAIEASTELAAAEGTYETFAGSPAAAGKLQYDLWNGADGAPVEPLTAADNSLDWAELKRKVAASGLRNSLLVAPMPTASTSQILGYNECFEPFTSNLYTRRTLAGEFIVINKHLMRELMAAGLWSEELKQKIVANNGSVQALEEIPAELRRRYKTAWEIPQKVLIDMAAARGAFICQSQSLNLFVADPNYAKLTSMHFYGWKKGLKTGSYYLRTKAPVAAQKFTVDPRLAAALAGGASASNLEDLADEEGSVSGDSAVTSDSEEEGASGVISAAASNIAAASVAASNIAEKETRQQLLDRLAREYEEAQAAALAQAAEGEGCLYCSS